MEAYIYKAELYCKVCGRGLQVHLPRPDYNPPFDSNDYPVGPYPDGGGESDCPQHCGGCGEFLENPLTADGYDSLREAIADGVNPVTQQWLDYYEVSEAEL